VFFRKQPNTPRPNAKITWRSHDAKTKAIRISGLPRALCALRTPRAPRNRFDTASRRASQGSIPRARGDIRTSARL